MGRSVCVVIPSVGNADELGIALDSLMAQTYYGPLEVVVVGPSGDLGRQQAESEVFDSSTMQAHALVLMPATSHLNRLNPIW